jgi:exosome complex component MTR3
MRLGAVPQATGSAYVECDRTRVMCGVYGPRPPTRTTEYSDTGVLTCHVSYAPFARDPRATSTATTTMGGPGGRDAAELEADTLLEQALAPSIRLDLFPKAAVDVYVTVIEDDGAALAAAIACASLALADAGIELWATVAACAAAVRRGDGHVLLDCTAAEERAAAATVLVAHMPALNETTQVSATGGAIDADALVEAVGSCVDGCAKLDEAMRACLVAAATKRARKRAA